MHEVPDGRVEIFQMQQKNGSSGRTRTYNPPVNSCTDGKTANYRQLRLILKIQLLRHFQKRLSAANSEGDSLKKSPKYFQASAEAADTCNWTGLRRGQRHNEALTAKQERAVPVLLTPTRR